MSLAEQGNPGREYSRGKIYGRHSRRCRREESLWGRERNTFRDLSRLGRESVIRSNKKGGLSRLTDGCPPLSFVSSHAGRPCIGGEGVIV